MRVVIEVKVCCFDADIVCRRNIKWRDSVTAGIILFRHNKTSFDIYLSQNCVFLCSFQNGGSLQGELITLGVMAMNNQEIDFDNEDLATSIGIGEGNYTEEREELLKGYTMEKVLEELKEMKIRRENGVDVKK